MNRLIEKIVERIKKQRDYHEQYEGKSDVDSGFYRAYNETLFIIKEEAKAYNSGWIPCSERLPEEDGKRYIVQKTNGFIDILSFTKDAYKLSRYDFAEYKGKKKQLFYDFDSEYGYVEWECEAWCPLPAPYQPKE